MNDREGLQLLKIALETMPNKQLGRIQLINSWGIPCALGCMFLYLGKDPFDNSKGSWSQRLGIHEWLLHKIYDTNDLYEFKDQTFEQRYTRMLEWTNKQLQLIDEEEAHELGG